MIGSRTWGALRPFAIRFTLLAILVGLFVSLPLALPDGTQAGFGTLTVNDTGDDNDLDEGDGVCEVTDGEGDCTLRAAIQEANESGLINTIDFDGNVFDPGTITLTKGSLPFVTKTGITIDASVNDVDVTLDVAGNDYGIGAVADENGFDFAVLGGGATLTIEEFALFGTGACGGVADPTPESPSDCDDFTLGDITIDGVDLTSTYSTATGIIVIGEDLDDINITNNNVNVVDGLLGIGVGAYGSTLIDGSVNISDNGVIQGGFAGIIVDYCGLAGLGSCDLGSKISVTINNNEEINGGDFPGVFVDYCGSVSTNSSVNVQINENGDILGGASGSGAPGVFVTVHTGGFSCGAGGFSGSVAGDLDPESNVNVTTQINENDSITSGDGSGVEVDIFVGHGDESSATTEVNGNDIIVGPGGAGVSILAEVIGFAIADADDDNTTTTSVSGNGFISAAGPAVYIETGAGTDNGHTSNAFVTGNTSLSSSDDDAVVVLTEVGGGSNNNESNVQVNGNDLIVSAYTAVFILVGSGDASTAGAGVAGSPDPSDGNTSDVEVNDNGVITGDSDGNGSGNGIYIHGAAGAFDTTISGAGSVAGAPSASDGNTSNVDISGNGDISGGDDAIEVVSEAGTTHSGSGTDNTSDVAIVDNGHITGDTDLDGTGTAIDVFSRAGTENAGGGVGDDNTSTVHILGTGETDVIGAAGINVLSEAGALAFCCGSGQDNTSTVVVNGHRDIRATDGKDAVNIITQAGAFGGDGDNNHASGEVSDNRFITVECCKAGGGGGNAVDIDAAAGGVTSTSALNSTTATVTGNDNIEGDDNGIVVASLVCCVSANTNNITIDQNQNIIGLGDDGILITGPIFGGLCCSENTIDVTDNGTITGTNFDGLDIDVFGENPIAPGGASHTVLTVSGNTFANSGDRGIEIENEGGATADFTDSVISDNAIRNNGGAGISLDGVSSTTIGPANIIEDNAGGTGIHIEESTGDADFNTITQNSIFENDGLGIDLDDGTGADVVGCVPEPSPNECIPFPTGVSSIDKALSGTTCPDCLVEIFVANAVPADQETGDPVQHGEGETFIGTTTANGVGFWTFTIPCGLGGESLTMTATGKFRSTSEFGPNFGPLPANSCDAPTPVPTDTPGGPPTDTPTPTDVPDTATITICKDTNPENDDGKTFDFDTDIPGMGDPDLEDDDCDTEEDVDPDEYEIIENPDLMPDGWELDEIDCDGIPSSRVDVDLGDNLVVIDVEAGDDIECTFTNVDVDPETSSIEICKDTNPETDGIDFEFEGDLDDFSLADDDCEEVTDLEAGEYEISEENIAEDWNLIEVDCAGTDEDNVVVDLDEGTVVVDLQEGEDVQCTFTNERKEAEATVTPTDTPTPTPTDTPMDTPTDTPTNTPTNTPVNTPVIPATPGNTIGDVNKNGVVNAIDAQLILQAEAGFITLANPKNADVNLDGRVDSRDAFLILQFVAAQVPSLPV